MQPKGSKPNRFFEEQFKEEVALLLVETKLVVGALDVTLVDAEGLLTSEAADDDLDVGELEDKELDNIDDELGGTAVEVGLETDELNV